MSSDILIDELFHEIDEWIAAARAEAAQDGEAALAMAEASLIPLD